jgi:hypothetical protein
MKLLLRFKSDLTWNSAFPSSVSLGALWNKTQADSAADLALHDGYDGGVLEIGQSNRQ